MSDLDDFRSEFLPRLVDAEIAFHEGDAGPRMKLWSQRDPVSLFGAAGMYKSGWEDVSETFEQVVTKFSDVTGWRFDLEVADVIGDMAYTVGFERYRGSIAGKPVDDISLRVTQVYRREDGDWKVIHRHGDSALLEMNTSEGKNG